MPRTLTRLQPQTNARQSSGRFYSREQRKALHDPSFGLFRTHVLPEGAVDTETLFPSPAGLEQITLSASVVCDAAGTVVVKIGSSSASSPGFGFRIAGGDLTLEAGAGSGSATENILETLVGAVPIGVEARIVVAAIPGIGKARAWVNGKIVIRGETSAGNFGLGWI